MQKFFSFLLTGATILLSNCRTATNNHTKPSIADTVKIFPVTSFIKGQLHILDSMPVTPLRTISAGEHVDSMWLTRADIRKFATPFLTPQIDSASMQGYYSEKSFLDQTLGAYTFSFDAKNNLPDSIRLTHWDVYVNPQSNEVERIYLVKENKDSITQLTWLTGKSFTVRTIIQQTGKEPVVSEEKLTWNFD